MKQILSICFIFVLLFAIAAQTFAQDATDSSKTPPNDAMEKKREVREDIKNDRETLKEEITAKRKTAREEIQKKREEMQENIKEKREEFKNKLQILKDEKKKALVERLDTKMSTINTNHTDRMLGNLEKMEDILARLLEKVEKAKGEGKNTTSAETLISEAQTAIDNAKTSVTEQAGKDYTPVVEDEATLRLVVGSVMSGLRSDLSTLHKEIVDAKQKVMNAAREVAKLRGNIKEPSGEPTVTN